MLQVSLILHTIVPLIDLNKFDIRSVPSLKFYDPYPHLYGGQTLGSVRYVRYIYILMVSNFQHIDFQCMKDQSTLVWVVVARPENYKPTCSSQMSQAIIKSRSMESDLRPFWEWLLRTAQKNHLVNLPNFLFLFNFLNVGTCAPWASHEKWGTAKGPIRFCCIIISRNTHIYNWNKT